VIILKKKKFFFVNNIFPIICFDINANNHNNYKLFYKKEVENLDNLNYSKAQETFKYLRTLKSVLELYYVDYNSYPMTNNINELIKILNNGFYILDAKTKDEWGNDFIYQSNGISYKIISLSADGLISKDDIEVSADHNKERQQAKIKKDLNLKQQNILPILHYSLNPGTVLSVSKSSNNVILAWTGTGTIYDVAKATDKYFLNNSVLAVDIIANTYTYSNALINDYEQEFFDVTDETEENRAAKNNGGDLPPPQPKIDVAPADLFIGGNGTINGSNFSTFARDNIIWFDGGVWTRPTSSTSTQLNFVVPRGAISGDLSVSVKGQTSDTIDTIINLEDTTLAWTSIRTMGYSDLPGEYWISGIHSSLNKVIRIFYDTAQKKYIRDEKQADNYQYACSTKTENSNSKKLFCGVLTPVGGGVTKVAITNPPPGSNVTFCTNLDSTSLTISVRGAAPDPNPDSLPSRNVVYFAYEVTNSGLMHIKKVAADCSGVIDHDYGNMGTNNFNFNPIVGMVVARNGDLYVAEKTQIRVIHPDESMQIVKTGFVNLFGLDIIQAGPNDIAILLISDGGVNTIYAMPLDSQNLYPIATASSLRACISAAETVNPFDGSLPLRIIIAHNDGGKIPLRRYPLLGVSPAKEIDAFISSPNSLEVAPFHSIIRPSDPNSTEYTVIKVRAWWKDGMDRFLCAKIADPIDIAGYAPFPSNPSNCDSPTVICDNKDAFTPGGVGSFIDTNQLESCKTCGANPCVYEFRITKRYAGDNYRVFFGTPAWIKYHGTTASITAKKRIYIEKDKMFKRGGILADNAEANTSIIYLAKNPDGTRADNIVEGDNIAIFDSSKPYESFHDEACVCKITDNLPPPNDFKIKVDLAPIGNCSQPCNPYSLSQQYTASPPDSTSHEWLFTSGNSAGVGVLGSGFYEADTSDLKQPFDDAFISFAIPTDGSNAIPFMPDKFFSGCNLSGNCVDIICFDPDHPIFSKQRRFAKIWFSKSNNQYNYVQLMGAGRAAQLDTCTECGGANPLSQYIGFTHAWNAAIYPTNISFIFVKSIEDYCYPPNQTKNLIIDTTDHEIAHQFYVNAASGYHDNKCNWKSFPAGCPALPGPCGVPAEACLMNPDRDSLDAINLFDADDLLCGDPGCPNGTNRCCNIGQPSCTIPGNGSIRQLFDPLIP